MYEDRKTLLEDNPEYGAFLRRVYDGVKFYPGKAVMTEEGSFVLMTSKTIIKVLSKLGAVLMFMLILSGTSLACRMYGVISNNLPDGLLQDHLVDAPYSLEALSYGQVDGWGIGLLS